MKTVAMTLCFLEDEYRLVAMCATYASDQKKKAKYESSEKERAINKKKKTATDKVAHL